jgi:hypothetical protein
MTWRWLGTTIVALLPALAWAEAPKVARPDLEVVLHVDGGMTEPPHYFILKVAFSGDVQGGGDLNPGLPAPPGRLPAAAHAELAAVLRKERFFDLPRTVGACPPDLGFRSIEAWQGTKKHSVTFCLDRKSAPLREVQSVLRTWYGVLSVVGQANPVLPTGLDNELLAREP